jgi:hypothetical protein
MRTKLTNTGNKELALTAVALSGANAYGVCQQRRHDLRGRDEAGPTHHRSEVNFTPARRAARRQS